MTKHVFCRDRTMLAATHFCHNKIMFVTAKYFVMFKNTCLLWQKFCHDKHTFVATKVSLLQQNFCHDKIMFLWQIFVATKLLSWQRYVCHDEHTFVTAKDMFCHDKRVCHNKHVFTTKVLAQQKLYLWQFLPMILCMVQKKMHGDWEYINTTWWLYKCV